MKKPMASVDSSMGNHGKYPPHTKPAVPKGGTGQKGPTGVGGSGGSHKGY